MITFTPGSGTRPLRRFNQLPVPLATVLVLFATGAVSPANQSESSREDSRPVEGIMDNSFLVEEAYNQEKDVVQHIFSTFYAVDRQPGSDDQFWFFTFTQEWPVFSQTHQFSYTIPYALLRSGSRWEDGIGDVLLNYRFQAYLDTNSLTAFAPRASLILPTGDKSMRFGEDTWGVQLNLPFSTTFRDRWFTHLNAGLTFLPGASSAQDRDLTHYNLGASVIYAYRRDLHFLVEWVGYWNQFGLPGEARRYQFSSLISPGLRKAFDFENKSQLVLGLAAPLGLNGEAPDLGMFLYVSFEHFIRRTAGD